jgi:alpha-glucosidase
MIMWWQNGVIYQIYIRSFYDTNGDGVGDIAGVTAKLDYLQELGVTGLWLSPTGSSPNHDWGYDVSDYYDVEPSLGSMSDLETLIATAKERGIRVILDLVPNHTSTKNLWFETARSSKDSPYRDWYIWANPDPNGGPPNNWRSSFGGSAWSFEPQTGQYYLHNFLPQQADLNWANPEVQEEFRHIMRFWFDRGVAGFRIDVVNMLAKDTNLEDNPQAKGEDNLGIRLLGQEPVYSGNGAAVHPILRSWRKLAEGYRHPRLLLGETMVYDAKNLASFYGNNDELQLGLNFPFWQAPFRAEALRKIVTEVESELPLGGLPAWAASNHDISRAASRWAHGNEAKIRLILMLVLTLRGTPVLYYGEELGMTNVHVPRWRYRDAVGKVFWPLFAGRDRQRTPMAWADVPNGGFTKPDVRPWLPLGTKRRNAATQQKHHNSTFDFTRRLISLRTGSDDLINGKYNDVSPSKNLWVFQRGERTIVILNLSRRAASYRSELARQLIATRGPMSFKAGKGHREWSLAPWEGIIIRLEP